MADNLTAALEEIVTEARVDITVRPHDCAPDWPACSAHNALRLVAAVEAVLALHQPVDRGAGAQCKGCATHVTFTWWPCPTVEAITRELTGKGGTDE